jgi:hypothetical protein
MGLTNAERQRRYIAKLKAQAVSNGGAEAKAHIVEATVSNGQPASYAPSYLAHDLPEEVPEGFGFVHSRNDRVPYVKVGKNGMMSGDGAGRVRVWMEKITDETHVRCNCSVYCERYIVTCSLTGAVDHQPYPHFVPRKPAKPASA